MKNQNEKSKNETNNEKDFKNKGHKREIKLNSYRLKFPLGVFPDELQKMLEHHYNVKGIQQSYLGASLLFSLSVACGNRYKLQFSGYDVIPSLWVAIVGDISGGKTATINSMIKPLQVIDEEKYKEYVNEIVDYKKLKDEDQRKKEYPIYKRFLVNDFTTESLVDILYNNPNGIGVYSDELKQWINNFDRYSKGSDRQFWLSIFTNSVITNDRKGKETIRINTPFASVIGGIQTSILKTLFNTNQSSDGFTERILFVLNETDERPIPSGESIDNKIQSDYYELIKYISNNSKNYYYGEDQIKWLINFISGLQKTYSYVDLAILGKMEIYLHRFILILQIINDYYNNKTNTMIEYAQVKNAIIILDYFINSYYHINEIINESDTMIEIDDDVKDWIESLPLDSFETRLAIKRGDKYSFSPSKVKRLLSNKNYFKRVSHGTYEKLKKNNDEFALTDEEIEDELLYKLWDFNNSDEFESELTNLENTLKEYFQDRKERKKELSGIAKKRLIEKIYKELNDNSPNYVIDKIERSIISGYNDIYFEF